MADVPHHRMAVVSCPSCGRPQDCTFPVDDGDPVPPTDGDYVLCLRCAELGIFDAGKLRRPTADERNEAMARPDVLAAQRRLLSLPKRP